MSSSLALRSSLVFLGALLVGHGCGGHGLVSQRDAGSGTGGGLAAGGTVSTGGTLAAGGAAGSGGVGIGGFGGTATVPIGVGGTVSDACSMGYPGNPFCGGAGGNPGTGGTTTGTGGISSGGTVSTGGARTGGAATGGTRTGTGGNVAAGGAVGAGGILSTADAGDGGGSTVDGDAATVCSCPGGITTFECFCRIHSCTSTLSDYTADAGVGGGYSTLEEYADCNLVVVTVATSLAGGAYVFDRTTGRLVGARYDSDVRDACPFAPDGSAYYTLSAGQFPDPSCVRTRCSNGIYPAIQACPDAGI
jgi:hypothetical protein